MGADEEVKGLSSQVLGLNEQLTALRRQRPAESVADDGLLSQDGSAVKLSELFGDNADLLVIHNMNMGRGCSSCAMWADGFVSALPHLEDEAAFVVVSQDTPEVQKEFAASRNWPFRMASTANSPFAKNLGFLNVEVDQIYEQPGMSAFHRHDDGAIVRTGFDFFGPGDDDCPPWRRFDLLQNGANDWAPKDAH
jgi:predicted dithiol-disulfide oxidoreductase (DUF899 family)